MRLNVRKKYIVLTTIGLALMVLTFWPYTDEKCRNNVLLAKSFKWYELQIPQHDTLYFYAQWPSPVLRHLSVDSVEALNEFVSNAFFSSFSGCVVTASDTVCLPLEWSYGQIRDAASATVERLNRRMTYYEGLRHEMDYYDKTHTVVDNGYHLVMSYNETIKEKQKETEHIRECMLHIVNGDSARAILRQQCLVYWQNAEGKIDSSWCENAGSSDYGIALWQCRNRELPEDLSRLGINLWSGLISLSFPAKVRIWANWGYSHWLGERDLEVKPAVLKAEGPTYSLPLTDGGNGAPVFNSMGQLVGVNVNGQLVPSWRIYLMQNEVFGWGNSLVEDFSSWIAWMWNKTRRVI